MATAVLRQFACKATARRSPWIKTPCAWSRSSSAHRVATLSRPQPVISSLWMHIRQFASDANDPKDDKDKKDAEETSTDDADDEEEVATTASSSDGRRRSRRRQRAQTTATSTSVQVIDTALAANDHVPLYPHVLAIPVYRRPLFPGVVVPMTISNPDVSKSLLALKEAGQQYVGVFLKKRMVSNETPSVHQIQMGTDDLIRDVSEIHTVGSYAKIDNLLAFEPSTLQLLLSAHQRIKIDSIYDGEHLPLRVSISSMENPAFDPKSQLIRAYSNEIVATLREILNLNPVFKDHMQYFQQRIDVQDPYKLADFAAAVTTADCEELQLVMEEMNAEKRLRKSLELLTKELELSKVQQVIKEQVEEKVSKNQRQYLLMEQLKVIKKELGLEKDDKDAMITKYRERLATFDRTIKEKDTEIKKSLIPEHVLEVIEEELAKCSMLEKNSSEFNVTRNYLDWLTQLPWGLSTDENIDLKKAKQILDEDHYGLTDIKDRILEFIAVSKLKNSVQGKIICFVGPPGVGKTSIGHSIARSLNREFYRFSVGGLSDVAEIKGHRRTYVGAMPGKVIQCLKTTQSSNPLILIDEIDKLGRGGYQGDPASALLELLDPSQHNAFVDHYMDVPVDLSRVLFICTANVTDTIPGPLLDRMEVLRLSGYDAPEKLKIAKEYLIPKVIQRTGLQGQEVGKEEEQKEAFIKTPESLGLTDEAILTLVKQYCRESGVRNLEKQVERIFRKIALEVVQEQEASEGEEGTKKEDSDRYVITPDKLIKYVGKPVFQSDRMYETLVPGVVMGLAWTAMGGSSLYIETTKIVSKGDKSGLLTTGQMGSVMEESTKIAYTYARHKLEMLDPNNSFFETSEIHLHVPEGATPKDGPSAGCTMVTAMLSLALNKAVRPDFAMTGELSLVGKVLPVGGIKEKVIAAKRSGVKTLVLPLGNQRDFDELEEYLRQDIDVHFADYYDDVYKVAFE